MPRPYQESFWNYMQNTPWGARAILCHHRRAGKDHTALNWCATASQLRVGLYIHVFPYANQARRVIWNGIDKAGNRFLDAFPEELIESRSDLEMRIRLKNGSIYQLLGADDPDKLVGINPIGVILSEYAIMDPMALDLVMPILNENGGWLIVPSTPRGENHFYKMCEHAKKNPKWFFSHETVDSTGAVDPAAIQEERERGVEEAMIQQEYYCSFSAPLQGAYYERQMSDAVTAKRIDRTVVYDPALLVHTSWDIGIDDSTTIWCFQLGTNKDVRLIDYYEATGEGFGHYIKVLTEKSHKHDWTFGKHYGPHDLRQRQMGKNTQTKWETALSLGLRFEILEKTEVDEGIEAVRQLLGRCWFNEKACHRGILALKSYRKQWDERLKVYRSTPLHDEYSHGADAFRYLAMALRTRSPGKVLDRPTYADNAYDPLRSANPLAS